MKENKISHLNFGPFFIAFAAFLWTLDAIARGQLSQVVNPSVLVFYEHLIIILVISPYLIRYFRGLKDLDLKEWFALCFIAIGGSSLATIAITAAYSYQNGAFIAIVALLQQTQPIIAIGFAHLWLKEKLPSYYYTLTFFAIFGVFLMFFPFLTNFTNDIKQLFSVFFNLSNDAIIAGILGLIAAFFWGSSTVFGRYLLTHGKTKFSYDQMTTYRFFIAFIFLLVFNLIQRNSFVVRTIWESPINFGRLLFIALVPGLLSLILYYYGLKTTHASVSAIMELAYPLSALVILPLVFKNQFVESIQIIGAIILIISSGLLSYLYGKMSYSDIIIIVENV